MLNKRSQINAFVATRGPRVGMRFLTREPRVLLSRPGEQP